MDAAPHTAESITVPIRSDTPGLLLEAASGRRWRRGDGGLARLAGSGAAGSCPAGRLRQFVMSQVELA